MANAKTLLLALVSILLFRFNSYAEPLSDQTVAVSGAGVNYNLSESDPFSVGISVQIQRSYANFFSHAGTGPGFAVSTGWMQQFEEPIYSGGIASTAHFSDRIEIAEPVGFEGQNASMIGSVMSFDRFTGEQFSATGFTRNDFTISSFTDSDVLLDSYTFTGGFGPIPQGGDGSFSIEVALGGWLSLGFSTNVNTSFGVAHIVMHSGIQWEGATISLPPASIQGVRPLVPEISLVGASGFDYANAAPTPTFPAPPVPLFADANFDGFVGAEDLDVVLAQWGDTIPAFSGADIDGDGSVGQSDLDLIIANWGAGTPPGANIPEPGSLAVLALGTGLFLRRRH